MGGEELTDDFEKAILIIFAQSGLVDPNLKVGSVYAQRDRHSLALC